MKATAQPATRTLSANRRFVFIALWLGFIALLCWIGWRVVLRVRAGVPIAGQVREIDVWKHYYPTIAWGGAMDDKDDDKHFDVVLLGGSVLQQVSDELESELQLRAPNGQPVRVYNLTQAAHTSLDSRNKFRLLKHRQFDLVVIYHGINDARMNCCSRDDYQQDYTHCDRYRGLNKRVKAKQITFSGLVVDVVNHLTPLGEPSPELAELGVEVKTEDAFRANLKEIIELAEEKSTRVVMMTFAYHLPDNYNLDDFEAGKLGYRSGEYSMRTESWGQPEGVRKALEIHNRVVIELSRTSKSGNITLVDANTKLTAVAGHFSDVCHLTKSGCSALVKELTAVVDR